VRDLKCSTIRKAEKSQNFVELPPEEIWFFKLAENKLLPKFKRFKVKKTISKNWEFNEVFFPILKECNFDVVTGLDENDDLIYLDEFQSDEFQSDEFQSDEFEEYRLKHLINKCNDLSDLIVDFKIYAEQLARERSISRNDFENIISIIEKNIDTLENWSLFK
jgi:hypothetical protein